MRVTKTALPYDFEAARDWYLKRGVPAAYLETCWIKNLEQAGGALSALGWSVKVKVEDYIENCRTGIQPPEESGLLVGLAGGYMFADGELSAIRALMKACKEESFFIVESAWPENWPASLDENRIARMPPPLALEFPAAFDESQVIANPGTIMKENGHAILDRFYLGEGDYFIFGSSGKWGKYLANNAPYPIEFLEFNLDLARLICPWFTDFIEPVDVEERATLLGNWLEQVEKTENHLSVVCGE